MHTYMHAYSTDPCRSWVLLSALAMQTGLLVDPHISWSVRELACTCWSLGSQVSDPLVFPVFGTDSWLLWYLVPKPFCPCLVMQLRVSDHTDVYTHNMHSLCSLCLLAPWTHGLLWPVVLTQMLTISPPRSLLSPVAGTLHTVALMSHGTLSCH